MEITIDGSWISLDIVEKPLIEVLIQIEEEAGIEGHFLGNLSELVTLSIPPVSLDIGLRRLVGNNSISFIYSEAKMGQSIAEMWVINESFSGESPVRADIREHLETSDERTIKTAGDLSKLEQSLQEFVKQGDGSAVMSLAAQLGDSRVAVRKLLVEAIGSIHNTHSIQILGQILYGDTEPEIRMMAVRYLSERKDEPAAKALIEGGLNDLNVEVRELVGQLLE